MKQKLGAGLCVAIAAVALVVCVDTAVAQSVPSTITVAGITLRSTSVDLPSSDRQFAGDATADPINNNCLACHSAGMVLNQPKMSTKTWAEEVNKMRVVYKAPVSDEDVPLIVDYLGKLPIAK